MNNTQPTYTGLGNTPQAQSTQAFNQALMSIQNAPISQMSPQQLGQGQVQAQSGALGLQSGYGPAMQQAYNQYANQSGLNSLQGQQADLGKIFQMYLADGHMAGQYSNGQNTNPYANAGLIAAGQSGNGQIGGQATSAPNPYLASTDQLAQSTVPTGSGFTSPNQTTYAASQPLSAGSNFMNLLNQAIGTEKGVVSNRVGDVSTNYQSAINALLGVANAFGTERQYQGNLSESAKNRALEQEKLRLAEFQAGFDPNGNYSGTTKTPQDYADGFMGGTIKWADIPSQFKQAVTTAVKQRGASVDVIQQGYKGIDDGIASADRILAKWNNLNEAQKLLPGAVTSAIPQLSPDRAGINAIFFGQLEPALRKSIVSGRVTQQEINWIKSAFLPTALDSEASAKQKLEEFKWGLEQKRLNPNYTIGDSTAQEFKAQKTLGSQGQTGSSGKYKIIQVK